MAAVSSLKALTLDLPPSCIAFCPAQPQYFVVGTYFLHPQEQRSATSPDSEGANEDDDAEVSVSEPKRSGSLILFRLERDTM